MKNNTFFKVTALASVLLFQHISDSIVFAQSPGFFLDDWQEKTAELPEFDWVAKPAGAATVTINVDMTEELNKVSDYIYGNNAVTWDDGLRGRPTTMKDLNNLNPHVLRWPGGNLSNNYFWNVSKGNRPADIPPDISPWYGMNVDSWQMSVDEYYDLLSKTSSTGIICVNYSYARYGTASDPVATAAHMAAEWVRYDNGRSKFWEIGNEDFGNWQAGYEIDVSLNKDGQPQFISGQLYGQHCKVFIDSMRAAAAEIGVDIKIGVVAFDAETSWDPIQTVWNEGMMPEVGDIADFLIVHSYFTPYDQNSTVSTILNSYTVPKKIMEDMVSDMAEANKPMIPVAMTEWNIFAVGSMQQVSYINGMLASMVLGEFIKNDYGLGTRWDLVNGWSDGNDHGMFSSGGEPGVDPYNPRAVFFYMYYFQKYFGDRMVQSTVTGNNNVIAYASSFTSGESGMVIINKGTTSATAQIGIDNFEPGTKYYCHLLTGGTDNGNFSRKVLINGIETDEQGGGPDEYESIRAFASETEGGIKINLPALSVVNLLVEKKPPFSLAFAKTDTNSNVIDVKFTEDVVFTATPTGFVVMLNGITPLTITDILINSEDNRVVQLFLEETLDASDELTISYSGSEVVSAEAVEVIPFSNVPVRNLIPVTITFKVQQGHTEEAIADCRIGFNNEIMYTDENGEASFIAPHGTYPGMFEKLYYFTLQSAFTIESDTTLTVILEKSHASIEFRITASSGTLQNTVVVLGTESRPVDSEGNALFLNLPVNMDYIYTITGDNFSDYEESFYLVRDTVITLLLSDSELWQKNPYPEIRIYPNPSTGRITIESDENQIQEIRLLNIHGAVIHIRKPEKPQNKLQLDVNYPAGIYMVQIKTRSSSVTSRLLIN